MGVVNTADVIDRQFRSRRFSAALIGIVVLVAASVMGTDPSQAQSEHDASATSTIVADTLPPEIPPTLTTTSPATSSTSPVTTTTMPRATLLTSESLVPVCQSAVGAAPLPIGPTLGCRIVASYGNPLSTGMGILGRLPPVAMLADITSRTAQWASADPARMHRCALELIVITAQASPGASGLYRARMAPALIDRVLGWARSSGCLLILDVQVGWSSVAAELPYLEPWLAKNDVHLALDPEWDMQPGVKPGARIGTMDADDINVAVDLLARLVRERSLAPKLMAVHRFRDFMVTRPSLIRTPPEVRLVVNMDGFGPPATKRSSYGVAVKGMPTTLTGFKLFTLLDKPILGPADLLKLIPVPVFINFQ